MEEVLLKTLGIKRGSIPYRQYHTSNPADITSHISVSVFKGTFASEDQATEVFLHELTFPDGQKRWAVGPDVDL